MGVCNDHQVRDSNEPVVVVRAARPGQEQMAPQGAWTRRQPEGGLLAKHPRVRYDPLPRPNLLRIHSLQRQVQALRALRSRQPRGRKLPPEHRHSRTEERRNRDQGRGVRGGQVHRFTLLRQPRAQ